MKELQKEIERVEGVLKGYEHRYEALTEPLGRECVLEVILRVREIEEEMKRGGN